MQRDDHGCVWEGGREDSTGYGGGHCEGLRGGEQGRGEKGVGRRTKDCTCTVDGVKGLDCLLLGVRGRVGDDYGGRWSQMPTYSRNPFFSFDETMNRNHMIPRFGKKRLRWCVQIDSSLVICVYYSVWTMFAILNELKEPFGGPDY